MHRLAPLLGEAVTPEAFSGICFRTSNVLCALSGAYAAGRALGGARDILQHTQMKTQKTVHA